jgi:hypothetical protein
VTAMTDLYAVQSAHTDREKAVRSLGNADNHGQRGDKDAAQQWITVAGVHALLAIEDQLNRIADLIERVGRRT